MGFFFFLALEVVRVSELLSDLCGHVRMFARACCLAWISPGTNITVSSMAPDRSTGKDYKRS